MMRKEILNIVAQTMNILEKEYGIEELSDLGGLTAGEIADRITPIRPSGSYLDDEGVRVFVSTPVEVNAAK